MQATASIAPAAVSRCPVMLLVEADRDAAGRLAEHDPSAFASRMSRPACRARGR